MPHRHPYQKNHYYHNYGRGLNRQTIFYDEEDYEFFTTILLGLEKRYPHFKILEYTLMPNHFHFVIHNKIYGLYISKFFERLLGRYSKYFIKKYGNERGKNIFEGRYHSKKMKDEKQLMDCKYYVALNPIKDKLVKDIKQRKYRRNDSIIEADISLPIKRKKWIDCQDLEKELEAHWEKGRKTIIIN